MKPLISFIIPVYQINELYIHDCIDSLINLNHRDIEIIIVDDGNPTSIACVCDAYAYADSRVKVIHKQNEGVSIARNRGIDNAEGKYVAFVDADDWIDTTQMDTILNFVRENHYDLFLFGHVLEYVKKRIVYEPIKENYAFNNNEDLFELAKMVFVREIGSLRTNPNCAVACSASDKIIKKSLLTEYGIAFDEDMTIFEDALFSLEVICNCISAYYIDITPYHYRMRESSVTHNGNKTDFFEKIRIYENRTYEYLESIDAPRVLTQSLYYRCFNLIFEYPIRIESDPIQSGRSIWESCKYCTTELKKEPFLTIIKELNIRDLGIKDRIKALILKLNALVMLITYKKVKGFVLKKYEEKFP